MIRAIVVVALTMFSLNSYAQPPDGTSGSDAAAPEYADEVVGVDREVRVASAPCVQYTELGSTVGLWDWRAESYEMVYYQGNSPVPAIRTVPSPFHTTGANINHLAFTAREERDYDPADGWELLYRNLGVEDQPVQEPSFALYNRLDARIRIFFYLESNDGSTPDNVVIQIRQYFQDQSSKGSAIFENLNIPANAVLNFDKITSFEGVGQLNRGIAGSNWYLLESVASYDPCSCLHESGLEIQPILTNVSSLSFEMEGTGEATVIYDAGQPVSALGFFNGAAGKYGSAYKKYKDFQGYLNDAQGTSGKTVKVLSKYLKAFSEGLSLTTGVTELLAFVLGKKSVGKEPKITGFNQNFSFTGNGGITGQDVYNNHYVYTPGSYYDENQLLAYRTIYDNPLGVFAVIRTPVVERQEAYRFRTNHSDYRVDSTIISYRFSGELAYQVNSLAGISSQPVELLASLVWPDQCSGLESFYATPAINITCLRDYVVTFNEIRERITTYPDGDVDTYYTLDGCLGEPQLQIVAVLKSNGSTPGQEIVFSARYSTQVVDVPEGTMGGNTFEGMTDLEIEEACGDGILPPVSSLWLSRVCGSQYDPKATKSDIIASSLATRNDPPEDIPVQKAINVYPNPFTQDFTVDLPDKWLNDPLTLQLYDVLGKKVWERSGVATSNNTMVISNGLEDLVAGNYILSIISNESTRTVAIQKQ